jgi:AraC-like DNA-binding protein
VANAVPQVPAGLFTIVTTTLDSLGFPPEQVLKSAGMPPWHYLDAGEMVSGHDYYWVMDWLARYLGDEAFGARLSKHAPITSLGPLGAAIRESKSLYDAINSINQAYGRASDVAQFFMSEGPSETDWLCKQRIVLDFSTHQTTLASLQYMIDTVRLVAGPDWQPAKIYLAGGKLPGEGRLETLGDSEILYFQGASGISLPKSLVPKKVPCGPLAPASAESGWADINTLPDSFVASLRSLLRSHIRAGVVRVASLADAVGMSQRTLQRRLGEEGSSFSAVLDDLRFELAAELIRDRDYPLMAIAHDLGYRDQAHFTRAFRRWTGMSPSEYRSHLQD